MLRSFSGAVLDKAEALVPGGVNSPVRAFASVCGTPPVIFSGKGAQIRDIDEKNTSSMSVPVELLYSATPARKS